MISFLRVGMVLWDKVVPPTREEVEGAVPEYRAWEGVPLHISAQLQLTEEGQGEMEKIPPEMVMVRRAAPRRRRWWSQRILSWIPNLGRNWGAGQVVLTVVGMAKVPQTITFGLDPATAKVGDATRPLIATSTSGLPVTLTSSDSRIATITSGNTLNIVGTGTTTITATQAGNSNYEAAMPVSVSLTVSESSGTTFASWSGNASVTSDLVSRYAFGAVSKTSAPEK